MSSPVLFLDRLVASSIIRAVIVLVYITLGAVVALAFPDTPDELSRIAIATAWTEGNGYDYFWPPGNVFAIGLNPLFYTDLDPVMAVRLFNLVLAATPICLILYHQRSGILLLVALFTAPYCYLVLSTASQQGLMIGLLAIMAWSVGARRLAVFTIAALAFYLVNPAMVLVLPGALLFLAGTRFFRRAFVLACLSYLPILAVAFWLWQDTGTFRPTLSGNGQVNVFLGNNPDPLSHRGVGDLEVARATLDLRDDASHLDAVVAFARDRTGDFLSNMAAKAALYWAPWDFLRSGMGTEVSTVLFVYIGMAQAAIYATFWVRVGRIDRRQLVFAVAVALAAWALYTLFFVKIRFRVPFDILLLITCLLPVPRLATRTRSARHMDPEAVKNSAAGMQQPASPRFGTNSVLKPALKRKIEHPSSRTPEQMTIERPIALITGITGQVGRCHDGPADTAMAAIV